MKVFVKSLDINDEYLISHDSVPFTLNKRTTGDYIYTWNTSPKFFPSDMKDSSIRVKYMIDHAKMVGLDDLVMPDQRTDEKLIEECHELTLSDFREYYKSDVAKDEDSIWNVDKFYNALFMSKDTHNKVKLEFGRGISLVYPAADCAVVRFYDPKLNVIGLTHADAIHTTRGIISKSINYMVDHFKSKKEDIEVYVGAFAKDGWVYDKMPSFALGNSEWNGYIEEKDGKYLINYGDKVYDQIKATGVDMDKVYFDPDNTLFNDNYFSNSRSYNSKVDGVSTYREGRNMMGITFDKDEIVYKNDEQNVILR